MTGTNYAAELNRLLELHPRDRYHEDHGTVLWHSLDELGRICEPPICACEPDDEEPWVGYYTHWSFLPRLVGVPVVTGLPERVPA